MNRITVGVIDYGMGNHASVTHSLRALGFRVCVSSEVGVLNSTKVLVLPGVGAYPAAMQELSRRNLIGYLQDEARVQRPIMGICLGMQLLASASLEHGCTEGLGLIPGQVIPLVKSKWHIGWNTIECTRPDSLVAPSDGEAFYFNHSFCYQGPEEYQLCITRHPAPVTSVIRRGSVVGVQFHPEKSQAAGRVLLKNLITGLVDA